MIQARQFSANLAILALLGAVWVQIFCSPNLLIGTSPLPASHSACHDSEADSPQPQTPAPPPSPSRQRCCTAPDLFVSASLNFSFTPASLANHYVKELPIDHHVELMACNQVLIQTPSDQPVLRI